MSEFGPRKALQTAGAGVAAIMLAQFAVASAPAQVPAAQGKSVQRLMAEDVMPSAEVYWNSVQFITDETGEQEIVPETDEDWARTKAAAVRLGELGELLKTPGYAAGRGEDWIEIADGLIEVSQLAERAAEERDVEKTFDVGGTIYNVCLACHRAYPGDDRTGSRSGRRW